MFKRLFSKSKTKTNNFTCSCCGKTYNEIPLCFGNDYPYHYYSVPKEEIKQRVEIAESLCIIDDHYFHRGRLTIPIIDYSEDLIFNVWTSISKANFEIRESLWHNPNRINQEPYFGYLQTIIDTYNDTINIHCIAIENEVGYIPTIKVVDEQHPLFYDQQNGISLKIATQKAHTILKHLHKG